MAIQDILDQLEKDKKHKLKDIEKDFNKALADLKAEYEEKRKNSHDSIDNRARDAKAKVRDKAETASMMENKNETLKAKREILNKLFADLVAKLVQSSKNEEYLVKLIETVGTQYKGGQLIPAEGQVDAVKAAVKKAGSGFTVAHETVSKQGGFVFSNEHIEIDLTFESIVNNQLRDDLESKAADILFS